ncbi:MAG: alpha/beta hydrolase [Actinomycetota bacterium]|nr:alpha/beta hydrolase [Actinomycetota bacterium]
MTVDDHLAPPLALAEPWGGEGRVVDLGLPVHIVDFGGPTRPETQDSQPPMVLVHGLGGSHLNWLGVAPQLRTHRRVYALDLAGFGLTPGTEGQATVKENVLLVARFVREVVGEPVVLVGNSMGGMISVILAATHPELVSKLILVDPSIPTRRRHLDRRVAATFLVYGTPRVGEAFLTRLTAGASDERRVQETTNLCFAHPDRADAAVIAAAVDLVAHRRPEAQAANAAYLSAARSILRVLGTKERYRDLIRSITAPVLLIHGDRDRLVPVTAARQVAADNPSWTTVILPDVGHVPMLETPEPVAALIDEWLTTEPEE